MTFCLAVLLVPLAGVALFCLTGRRSAAQVVGAAVLWAMAAAAAVGVASYGRERRLGWHERLEMTLETLPVAAVLGAVVGALCAGARVLRRPTGAAPARAARPQAAGEPLASALGRALREPFPDPFGQAVLSSGDRLAAVERREEAR